MMAANRMPAVRAGFVGLTDCAPLIVAQELGFDRQNGIVIEPVKLSSWTAARDALAFEKVECTHIPGALALAMHLGLSGVKTAIRVPLLLGQGGNAITVSVPLYQQALQLSGGSYDGSRAESAVLVKKVVAARKAQGQGKIQLGSVHSYSSHNYELRAWLAYAGLDPENDVDLIVVPRSKMVQALANGDIDGFCVGDPWGQKAVEEGVGVTLATKADLYPFSPEKVLAFRSAWTTGYKDTAEAVVRSVTAAMEWASDTGNHADLAQMLTHSENVRVSAEIVRQALACEPKLEPGKEGVPVAHYLGFNARLVPSDASALWLLAQMRRWGQITKGFEPYVKGVFAPLSVSTTAAADALSCDNPSREAFDGVGFVCDDVEAYWRSFSITAAK